MPRRNRVTPHGEIVAVPARGTLMGNRGLLHDPEGQIRRPWALRRWILCVLEFKGRHRQVMAPGRYTELFFLDEATGLAAGHRPCAECQRPRYLAFRDAWASGNPWRWAGSIPKATEIDDRLHADRLGTGGSKRTFEANLDELPDGVFVTLEGLDEGVYLLWDGHLLAWSSGGYRGRMPRPRGAVANVLTPRSTVEAIRVGYVPMVHPSAASA